MQLYTVTYKGIIELHKNHIVLQGTIAIGHLPSAYNKCMEQGVTSNTYIISFKYPYQEVCGDLPLQGRMRNFAAGMICLHMFSIVTLKIT